MHIIQIIYTSSAFQHPAGCDYSTDRTNQMSGWQMDQHKQELLQMTVEEQEQWYKGMLGGDICKTVFDSQSSVSL